LKKISYFLVLVFLPVCTCAADRLVLGKPVDTVATISSRVLERAYRQIGISIRFEALPAERSLLNANQGSLDGDVNRVAGIEKKYANLLMVPVPVNTVEHIVVTKNHHFSVDGWGSLKPYSIAIRIGTKVVESGTAGLNVTAFPTYEKIFNLLDQDRYQISVVSRITAMDYINRYRLKDLRVMEPPLTRLPLYHYLHKKHLKIVEKITRSLQGMLQEGVIARERELVIQKLLNEG
jgi:hypothetical protein